MPRAISLCLISVLGIAACNSAFYLPSKRLYDWPDVTFWNITIPTEDGLKRIFL